MTVVRVWSLALLLGSLAVPAIAAQSNESVQREEDTAKHDLQRFHGLVEAYRKGQSEPVAEILAMPARRLVRMMASAATERDKAFPWHPSWFKAAAMLHTDAGIDRLGLDGERTFLHLEAASRVLAKAGPELHEFARTWYVGVARLLRDKDDVVAALQVLEIGRKALPRDAVILYESGVVEEWLASVTNVSELTTSSGTQRLHAAHAVTLLRTHRAAGLSAAAEYLGQSMRLDGTSVSARLHFGRVLTLRNSEADGLTHLAALAAGEDAAAAYLARLFIGAVHERRGRLEPAIDSYREALAAYGAVQGGTIALSQALQRAGRITESRDMLAAFVATPAASRSSDPWWTYFFERRDVVEAGITALRAESRQ